MTRSKNFLLIRSHSILCLKLCVTQSPWQQTHLNRCFWFQQGVSTGISNKEIAFSEPGIRVVLNSSVRVKVQVWARLKTNFWSVSDLRSSSGRQEQTLCVKIRFYQRSMVFYLKVGFTLNPGAFSQIKQIHRTAFCLFANL